MPFPPPEPLGYYYNNCTNPVIPEGFPSAGRPCQVARLLCYANGGDPQGGFDAYARFAYPRKTGVQTNGMTVTAEFFALIRSPITLYNDGHGQVGAGERLVVEHNYYCGDAHPNEDVAFWELRDGDFKPYDSGVNEGWSPVGGGTIDANGTCMGTKVGSTGMPENPAGNAPHAYPGYSQICWATGLTRWEGWTVLDEMLVLKWDMEGY